MPRSLVPKGLHETAGRVYGPIGRVTGPLRTLPDFVVVGGQRCGTTSIFKNLSEHSALARPVIDKGTDYYTLHFTKGIGWYRSRFPTKLAVRARGSRAQVFEACTYYMFHPFAIERMSRDLPDIKLVAMLRDPVERAFSAYKHELARGFETEKDFMRALLLEDQRLEGEVERMATDPTYASYAHRHHAYRRRGQYAEQLERIFAHYPRDRVHVLTSEEYFLDPAAEFDKVQDFLGLGREQAPHLGKVNSRASVGMPQEARDFLTAHYADHDAALAEILGRPAPWRPTT